MLGNETCLFHLRDHEVPSGQRLVRIEGRVVSCRLVDHTYESCALLHCKVYRILSEECLGSGLDSVCITSKEHLIHVHVHDLVLGIVALELHGCDPLLQLDPYHLKYRNTRNLAAHVLTRIEGLGELLGDRTSTSLA